MMMWNDGKYKQLEMVECNHIDDELNTLTMKPGLKKETKKKKEYNGMKYMTSGLLMCCLDLSVWVCPMHTGSVYVLCAASGRFELVGLSPHGALSMHENDILALFALGNFRTNKTHVHRCAQTNQIIETSGKVERSGDHNDNHNQNNLSTKHTFV